LFFFFFQAEDGIRDFCLSRGLGDVIRDSLNGLFASPNEVVVFLLQRLFLVGSWGLRVEPTGSQPPICPTGAVAPLSLYRPAPFQPWGCVLCAVGRVFVCSCLMFRHIGMPVQISCGE